MLRTGVSPSQVAQAVRAQVQALDPNVILQDFGTLQDSFVFDRDRMDIEHAELGKHAAVAPVLAVIALFLAAIGVYAVIAHSASQRTKEIGVRLAVGAAASDIGRMVRRDGMRPVFVGLIAGLAISLGGNRLLQSQQVGVSPYDPVTIAGGAILLVLVALLGCQLPIRKAASTDPAVALRCD
jgi:ABC-type antimicrobial peptide transport system permease subunit